MSKIQPTHQELEGIYFLYKMRIPLRTIGEVYNIPGHIIRYICLGKEKFEPHQMKEVVNTFLLPESLTVPSSSANETSPGIGTVNDMAA